MTRLAELMREKGFTDKALAKKLNCAPSTVFQWRTGVYLPRIENLRPLCQALKCSADDLLGIEVEKPTRLTRAESVELYKAITMGGVYNSQMLHAMATKIRRGTGKTTDMERWLRELAEAVYKVELMKAGHDVRKALDEAVQLQMFGS